MYRRKLFVGIGGFGLSKLSSVKTMVSCEYDIKAMRDLDSQTMLGCEFKKKFPNYKAMKVIGDNHCGFQYKIGINANDEPFNPSGTCQGGGLYFTDETNISRYCGAYGQKIAVINLSDNELVYIDGNKCKVNSFEITDILEIRDWMQKLTTYDELSSIRENPYLIQYINNLDVSFQMSIIKHSPFLIQYIDNPDVLVQMEAIKHCDYMISFIANPDISVQMKAIKSSKFSPFVIRLIANPDVSVQMEVIKYDPFLIRYIHNPDVSVQMEAIKHDPSTIRYVHNPDVSVQMEAIKHDSSIIRHIEYPNIYVQMLAPILRIKNYFV